jgi:hypothetical protein
MRREADTQKSKKSESKNQKMKNKFRKALHGWKENDEIMK